MRTTDTILHEEQARLTKFLVTATWPLEFERLAGRLELGWHFTRWTPPSLAEILNGALGTVTLGKEPSPFFPEDEYFKIGNHPVTLWHSMGGAKNQLNWADCEWIEVPRHHAEFFIVDINDRDSEYCHVYRETFTENEKDMLRKGGCYIRRVDLMLLCRNLLSFFLVGG